MRTILTLMIILIYVPIINAQEKNGAVLLQEAFIDAAEKVAPAVVNITVDREKDITPPEQPTELPERIENLPEGLKKYWERLFRLYQQEELKQPYFQRPNAPVSGVLISPQGEILTSYYNIAGQIRKIVVKLADQRTYEARIVASDKLRDLALLKIEGESLPSVALTPINIKVGSWVIVVGRGTDVITHTLDKGIVSAVGRFKNRLVQIDAKVNYANAGGALVDINGSLIGIVSYLTSYGRQGQSTGVGFATPAEEILKTLPTLQEGKDIEIPKIAFLGIQGRMSLEETKEGKGIYVIKVLSGTAAHKAGILSKDVIVGIDGIKIESYSQFVDYFQKQGIGAKVKLKLIRAFKVLTVDVTLGYRLETF